MHHGMLQPRMPAARRGELMLADHLTATAAGRCMIMLWCLFADARIGKYYGRYIAPYKGTYGTGPANGVNRFWTIAGNHDVSECSWTSAKLIRLRYYLS